MSEFQNLERTNIQIASNCERYLMSPDVFVVDTAENGPFKVSREEDAGVCWLGDWREVFAIVVT